MNFENLFARHIHPGIAGLARYTAEIAGKKKLPRRSQFDPSRVASLLDYMYMVDVLFDVQDYYFSYSGWRMATLFGIDLSGRLLSEIESVFPEASIRDTYDCVVATGQPYFMRGHYTWPGKSVPIERLLIPMTDAAGTLDTICGLSIPAIADVDLEMFVGHGVARLICDDELLLKAG